MIREVRRWLVGSRGSQSESGVALTMLLAFMVLAVPLTIAALQVASQFSRSSQVYDQKLASTYSAGAGMQLALFQIFSDPNFDDGLTPDTPSRVIVLDNNGETVNVTVTKLFTATTLPGQGLSVTKEVTPTSTPPDIAETYTYTITATNLGSDINILTKVKDLLPPGFTYVSGSTSGVTTANPNVLTKTANGSGPDTFYLNDAASDPREWSFYQGEQSVTGSFTPAQSTWQAVPEYWEMAIGVDGQFVAGTWTQSQWWYTTQNNQWRWKLQRVRGADVTDLGTSSAHTIPDNNKWKQYDRDLSPGAISIQPGDAVRLRLEVYSSQASAANRQFQYRWGGLGGGSKSDSNTTMPGWVQTNCGTSSDQLTWNLPDVPLAPWGGQATLQFQSTATRQDGTYYNNLEGTYRAWWDGENYIVESPPTAQVTVGAGGNPCNGGFVVSKTVVPPEGIPDVQTTFTFTITVENKTPFYVPIKELHDLLPAGFTYVPGSSTGIWPYNPTITYDPDRGRYDLKWNINQNAGVPGLGSVIQTLQATATLPAGLEFYNEAWINLKNKECIGCPAGSGQSTSSGSGAVTSAIPTYDVEAVAADGTVLSRVQFSASTGVLTVLSWQEY